MWGADTKTLTFSLTSNPGSWPTANSTTLTNYTYTLNDVNYTFGLKNVKCNSGYLMLTSTAVLGLPAIKDYKLTKVVAKNSSGCSTTTKVGISSSSSSASYISGGAIQTWSTTSSSYTYTLSGTSNNTVYYLYVTNKNAQITELTLTYEAASSKTLSSISVKTAPSKTTYTEGEYFDPTGLVITKTYSDASTEDLAYAGHTSDFTFSPSTTTALTTSNTSITITVGGKSTSQTIMVNPKPKYTVTLKDDNTELPQASVGASVILPSRTGCTGYTFAGWTKSWTSEQSSWTTTAPTIIPAGSYTPAGNENLYPVYTKTESSGGTTTKTLYYEPFTGSANSSAVQSTNVAATTDMFTDASATVWSHYSFNAGTTTSYATNLDGDAMSNGTKITKQVNNSTVTMMEVTGINISNASNLSLSLYNRRSYTSAILSISYKIDNGDYTAVGGTMSYNSTNDNWKLCDGLTISGTGNSLSLKIQLVVSGTTNRTMTLDDIKITGTVSNSTTSYTSVPSCAPKFKISSSLTGQGSILWSLDGETFGTTIADQPEGADVYFKLIPASGYEISGTPTVSNVAAGDITDFEDGIYSFTMPASAVTVSATFAQPAKYSITYDKGNFTSATGTMPSNTEVNPNTDYTVSSNTLSLTGYTFKGWNTNKDATTGLTNITVNDNITLYAIFTINSYNVTFTPSVAGGSIKVNGSSTSPISVQYNSNVTITVTPTSKYFKLTTLTYNSTDIKDAKSFTMPDAPVTIVAEFTEDTKYTITFVDKLQQTASIPNTTDNKIVVYENEIFTFPTIGDKTPATSGTCEQIHYHFMGWSTSEGSVSAGDIKTGTSAAVTSAATYYAVWAKEEL